MKTKANISAIIIESVAGMFIVIFGLMWLIGTTMFYPLVLEFYFLRIDQVISTNTIHDTGVFGYVTFSELIVTGINGKHYKIVIESKDNNYKVGSILHPTDSKIFSFEEIQT